MHSTTPASSQAVPKEIFKAYDIRGIVDKTLTPEIVEAIGHALGSEAVARAQKTICVGYDGRLSGPTLASALSRGIRKAGIDVINLGLVATPVVYFAAFHLKTDCGVMVTGSHNPPDYNGLKMVLNGETLSGDAIQGLRQRIETNDLVTSDEGQESSYYIDDEYIAKISDHIKLARPMKIAADCGNGVAGAFAKKLYEALGCQVEELFCEVDGNFPNHHPDPSVPDNLKDLIQALKTGDSEIGLAFDGDGDRLGVVTKEGNIIYPDRQLLLFAEDVLKREPGATIIYDVKSTRNLAPWIKARGGIPLMWKTGHSLVKAKMKETGSALAGEMSGHVFFKERWYGFDDATYTAARLLEILSKDGRVADDIFNALPDNINTPELNLTTAEGENHSLVDKLVTAAHFPGAKITTIVGLRVDYEDGFGLVRASNTTPCLVFRFEATTEAALARIQKDFRQLVATQAPEAELPF
ncbi:MAG: phosphomannomutase/phosphoglucomutase [Methylophilaceae bacterium]|nr:MAG: phosphomannomutase/phosphoglucomutase [Methylophilaceae bacterium]